MSSICNKKTDLLDYLREKSDLLDILEPLSTNPGGFIDIYTNVVDGTALVNSLDPKLFKEVSPKTFEEYSKTIFEQHLQKKLQKFTRCDIVFDIYDREASLKAHTREGRGSGNSLKVKPTNFFA